MNELKVNVYGVLEDCILAGIDGGWNKAHKHTDSPSEEEIKNQIAHYIMLEISEKFIFDEPKIE